MYDVTGVRGAQVKGNTNSFLATFNLYILNHFDQYSRGQWVRLYQNYPEHCLQLSLDSSFKGELESKAIENTCLAHPLTKSFGCKYKIPCIMT